MSISSQDNIGLLYTPGTAVWAESKEHGWVRAHLVSVSDKEVAVALENGKEQTLKRRHTDVLPPLCNDENQSMANDLTTLNHLHEPAVLHCLTTRFPLDMIYTYSGIVLVAINPFKKLPSLYSNEMIHAYRGQQMGDLEPHLFAVAEESYQRLVRDEQSQSIIVSGESGAGKTVSAKFTMRYLAAVGGVEGHREDGMKSYAGSRIEDRIMASNPILEAFGNAKTTRNDNSSRFGKFMQVLFGKQLKIGGALIRTYLLEKSRVVLHAAAERNYHIFYQLLAGATAEEQEAWHLSAPANFHYTNQGESTVPDVDDGTDFAEVRRAFATIGMTQDQVSSVCHILAGILHLGNVTSSPKQGLSSDQPPLLNAATLLAVPPQQLAQWLAKRRIVAGKDAVVKPMTVDETVDARDALAKATYARLFDWIVAKINATLGSGISSDLFIGILDIYGFEHFDKNSFEQFCINYANENLQQQFTQYVFKREQEDYVREQIKWSFIGFVDNAPCLDMIEGKMGVFSLLDEECVMANGSDTNFAEKLSSTFANHEFYERPKLAGKQPMFTIKHYAAHVTYDCTGFLEKNKDRIAEELLGVMRSSSNPLVQELFASTDASADGDTGKGGRKKPSTVGSQFRASLRQLMDTIYSTNTHYVRCIKPNMAKRPGLLEPLHVIQQLRACGVLETIKISAAGYPSKITYDDFYDRYRVIKNGHFTNRRELCETVVAEMLTAGQYQLGKTKLFLRAGQQAVLDKQRAIRLNVAVIKIQAHVRAFMGRRQYLRLQKATVCIQAQWRGVLARRSVLHMRQQSAAITIQLMVRGHQARCRYHVLRQQHTAALLIQKQARGFLARKYIKKQCKSVVFMQCCIRRRHARNQLQALRAEARDLSTQKERAFEMERKVIKLQQQLDAERRQWHEREADTQKRLEKALRAAEDAAALRARLAATEEELSLVRKDRQALQQQLSEVVATAAVVVQPAEETPEDDQQKREARRRRQSVFGKAHAPNVDFVHHKSSVSIQGFVALPSVGEPKTPTQPTNPLTTATAVAHKLSIHSESPSSETISPLPTISRTPSARGTRRMSYSGPAPTTPATANSVHGKDLKSLQRPLSLAGRSSLSTSQLHAQAARRGTADTAVFLAAAAGAEMSKLRKENEHLRKELEAVQQQLRQRPADYFIAPIPTDHTQPRVVIARKPDAGTGTDEQVQMFEYHPDASEKLLSALFAGNVAESTSGQPVVAFVLWRCVRYDVYLNRLDQLATLSTLALQQIKDILMETSSLDVSSYLLANTVCLYGALLCDQEIVRAHTTKLLAQLQNLGLFAYRVMMSILEKDTGLQEDITAVLEYNPKEKPSLLKRLTGKQRTIQDVVNHLSAILSTLRKNGLPAAYVESSVMRVMEHMGSQLLSKLVLRRDLCSWSSAGIIEANLAVLKEWLAVNQFDKTYSDCLQPIEQAANLLRMATKLPGSLPDISCLSAMQVRKLLQNFHGDYGEQIAPATLASIISKLDMVHRRASLVSTDVAQLVPPPVDIKTQPLPHTDIPANMNLAFLREVRL